MPFPIELDGRTFDTPPALAVAVLDDARAGRFPDRRLSAAHARGDLSRDEAVGLAAALIQTGDAAAVACGARLARALRDPALARLLILAVDTLDMGTLLAAGPDGRSVEDELLDAAAHALGDDPTLRAILLERLRNAGLAAAEVRVLATRGTAEEIRAHLPTVLLEGVPPGSAEALAEGWARDDDDVAEALIEAVRGLDRAERTPIWAAVAKRGVHRKRPEVEAALRA